jgi:hypothetical protein
MSFEWNQGNFGMRINLKGVENLDHFLARIPGTFVAPEPKIAMQDGRAGRRNVKIGSKRIEFSLASSA